MTAIPKPKPSRSQWPAPRASWSIHVDKEYHKFSAAHFLIFDDGSAERLHGHNYRVSVDLTSARTSNGMVVDFKRIKPWIGAILDRLDERLLIPGEHPLLSISSRVGSDGLQAETEIRYADRRYVAPTNEVCVLPIRNSSSENLAEWIAHELCAAIERHAPEQAVRSLSVGVEETAGQRGVCTLDF